MSDFREEAGKIIVQAITDFIEWANEETELHPDAQIGPNYYTPTEAIEKIAALHQKEVERIIGKDEVIEKAADKGDISDLFRKHEADMSIIHQNALRAEQRRRAKLEKE